MEHKGISVHMTGETSPKKVKKMARSKKMTTKLGKLLKKVNNLTQQCAEFRASVWEGTQHCGWKFSILGWGRSNKFQALLWGLSMAH